MQYSDCGPSSQDLRTGQQVLNAIYGLFTKTLSGKKDSVVKL
jgi:hypothetical protein